MQKEVSSVPPTSLLRHLSSLPSTPKVMFLSENLSPLQGDVVLALTRASVLPDPQVVHREPRAAYLSMVIVKCPWPWWARLARGSCLVTEQ